MLRRLLTTVRLREVLVLQGTPALGFVLGASEPCDPIAGALLCATSVLLVAAIWTFNDWADFRADRLDAGRENPDGVRRGRLLGQAVALLAASGVVGAALPVRTQALAAAIAALGFVYSAPGVAAKSVPGAGALVHLAGGLAHFLMGRSARGPVDAPSLLLGLFFALVFTAGHGVQEVQDHQADLQAGVRTGAVALGARRAFRLACALFGAAYAVLFALCRAGLAPRPVAWVAVVAMCLQARWSREVLAGGLDGGDVARLRWRYRVLFALIGAAMLCG